MFKRVLKVWGYIVLFVVAGVGILWILGAILSNLMIMGG